MNKWKFDLHLEKFYHDGNIEIEDKAKLLIKELLKLKKHFVNESEFDDIVEEFELVSDVEEFDDAMNHLYDFADFWKIWIATF